MFPQECALFYKIILNFTTSLIANTSLKISFIALGLSIDKSARRYDILPRDREFWHSTLNEHNI